MYELGFDKTPEQKVGALFWRMHRCARIIFSLNFHMGLWSPQRVRGLPRRQGRPRARQRRRPKCAARSSRRSTRTSRSIRRRICSAACSSAACARNWSTAKVMTNKQFHDEIMRQGNMPIALHPPRRDEDEAHARHGHQLEVLRRSAVPVSSCCGCAWLVDVDRYRWRKRRLRARPSSPGSAPTRNCSCHLQNSFQRFPRLKSRKLLPVSFLISRTLRRAAPSRARCTSCSSGVRLLRGVARRRASRRTRTTDSVDPRARTWSTRVAS